MLVVHQGGMRDSVRGPGGIFVAITSPLHDVRHADRSCVKKKAGAMATAARWRRHLLWLAIGAVSAALFGIVLLNVWPQEKQLEHRLGHDSAVESAQFRREIGTLLGAEISEGNAVADFQNGEQIFPAMLAAIRDRSPPYSPSSPAPWSAPPPVPARPRR
jgi:hypothetical protein